MTAPRCRASVSLLWVLPLFAMVVGCATKGSVPPLPRDVQAIPDATPRQEPRSKYGNPASYVVFGRRYHVMATADGYVEQGIASWYGPKFHGKRTSSGEPYDMYAMTAAHKTLPLPTYVRVTNIENGRSIVVRVNDRGPFVNNRIIDLSYVAAHKLDIVGTGTGLVEIEALAPGKPTLRTAALTEPRDVDREPHSDHVLFIQVGAFTNRQNAEAMRSQLLLNGIDEVQVERASASVQPVYRVRIGPLATIDSADSTVRNLERIGLTDYHIVID